MGFFAVACAALPAAARLPDAVDRNRDGEIVIACLGDSNTASGWQAGVDGGFPSEYGWCEQLSPLLEDSRVRVLNFGIGGATMSPNPLRSKPEIGVFLSGLEQLDYALVTEPIDVVMAAFGTNDVVLPHGGRPEDIVDYHNRAFRRARSHGLLAFVATVPPAFLNPKTGRIHRPLDAIRLTNELLRETFPRRVLLDFERNMRRQKYLDHLHMNAAGQAVRAREARRRLVALAEVTLPPAGVRALRWDGGHWRSKTKADLGDRIGMED